LSSASIKVQLRGFSLLADVITIAVRWYLRYGLSYRDVEELLAERGVEVDHVTIYRWVQRFTPLFIDAARPCRHATGDQWFVDETYVKVAGRWDLPVPGDRRVRPDHRCCAPALSARSNCRAGAARPGQGRRTAGLTARECRVAPPDLPGPLPARRPGMAGRLIPAAAAPPLGRGLRGHSRHNPGLAPQARLTEMGLHRPPPTRTSPDRNNNQKPSDAHGNRESHLGTPARAGPG
jgi:hypothetical protein